MRIRYSTEIYIVSALFVCGMKCGLILSLQRSLFIFDILMALGRVTDVKWIHEGKVYVGSYCTAQGKSNGPQILRRIIRLIFHRHRTAARRNRIRTGHSRAYINTSVNLYHNDLASLLL